ncbi:MAG: ABC transporter substrate-binding protein, partial [Eubacteriales bacterium]|nr:ABC transporter substrate-binding protein [Eubacteriales bacterium]
MKRVFCLLVAILLMSALPCAGAEEIVSAKDTLVIGVAMEPVSLDPYETAGAEAARVKRQVMEGLFEINDAGEYIPLLATSWEWENDTTLLFHLREGVTFSDGAAFTAQDVLYSITASKDGSLLKQYIDLEKTEIVDDYTIRIVMTEPTPLLFDKFESQHFPVIHQAAYESADNNFMYKPIGTGPYVVESWKTGDSVTLVRNENYWGTPAYCQKVIFRLIPESAQRTIEMEVGSIDINLDTSYEDMEYFQDENVYTIGQYALPTVNALFFNMDETHNSPVRDPKVRQAMAYAIDSEAISKSVYGVGQAANSNLSPYYAYFYNHDLTENDVLYRADLEKAKQLMQEAGYADGFDLTILLSENMDEQNVAEIMQYELAQIGINLQIVTRSSTTWFA